jgi:hypothetical protein
MPTLTYLQWVGAALIIGCIANYFFGPPFVAWIRSWRSTAPAAASDPAEGLADRMGRLAQLQTDLEQRGHELEAEAAGEWYSLLRDPIKQQEAPLP